MLKTVLEKITITTIEAARITSFDKSHREEKLYTLPHKHNDKRSRLCTVKCSPQSEASILETTIDRTILNYSGLMVVDGVGDNIKHFSNVPFILENTIVITGLTNIK